MTIAESQVILDQKDVEDQLSKKITRLQVGSQEMRQSVGGVACAVKLVIMHELVRLLWKRLMKRAVTNGN